MIEGRLEGVALAQGILLSLYLLLSKSAVHVAFHPYLASDAPFWEVTEQCPESRVPSHHRQLVAYSRAQYAAKARYFVSYGIC